MSKFNLEISGKVRSTTPGAASWYYGGDDIAWPDLATARINVPDIIRPNQTVGVLIEGKVIDYIWHPNDVSDEGLVLKTAVAEESDDPQGLPEPTTNGNWIRTKLDAALSWVEGALKNGSSTEIFKVATSMVAENAVNNTRLASVLLAKANLGGALTQLFLVADATSDNHAINKKLLEVEKLRIQALENKFPAINKRVKLGTGSVLLWNSGNTFLTTEDNSGHTAFTHQRLPVGDEVLTGTFYLEGTRTWEIEHGKKLSGNYYGDRLNQISLDYFLDNDDVPVCVYSINPSEDV